MGRIVGQIAKWPREPQNLSLDSGKPPPCPLRLEGRSGGLRNPLQSVRGNFRVEQGLGEILGGGVGNCASFQGAGAAAERGPGYRTLAVHAVSRPAQRDRSSP